MKRNYKLLLFIILVGIIFAPNVYAAGYNGKARYVSGDIYYGIKYSPDGTDQQTMKIHHQQMEIGGSRYPAYCVDPGLSASNGENYICYPTTDEGLKNLWSKISGLDYPTATMAARMYAILTGTGMEAIDKDGKVVKHDSINGPKTAVAYYMEYRDGYPPILSTYGQNPLGANQFLSDGGSGILDTAYNIAWESWKEVYLYNTSSSNGVSGIEFKKDSVVGNTAIINVTSSFNMIDAQVEFVCKEGCTISSQAIDQYKATLIITSTNADDCSFEIAATYKQNGVYECYSGSGRQFLITYVPDASEAEVTWKGGTECGEDCCTESPIEAGDLEGVVANCCTSSTHSYVKEYDLDDLFCTDQKLKVDKYWTKCNADYYINDDVTLNDYCEMYCTERVTIDVPGTVTSVSGRYFTLTKNPVGSTTSPYIQGTKRCRIRIFYDKWEEQYVATVKAEIKEYNDFQKNKAFEETYQLLLDAGFSTTYTATVNCTASASVSDKIEYKDEYDEDGNQEYDTIKGCKDDESTSFECSIPYTQHDLDTGHFKKYYGVQLKNGSGEVDNHLKVTVENDASLAGTSNYSKDMPGVSSYAANKSTVDLTGCQTALSTKEGQVGASCSSDAGSASTNWSCSLDYSGLQPHIADVTAIHANYLSAANTANTSYQTYAATAKLLEEQIKRCNTFFETTSAEEMYDFDPAVSFRYNQIYRDDDGSSVLSTIEIGYKETPGCVITKSLGGPSTYDGGMDTADKRYSTIYKEGELITIDFANTSLSRADSATGYQTFLDTEYDAPKVFTHDAKYIATCEWEEDENEIHTLVPTGAAEETSATNFTRHGYEYKVYLTTYQGTYETDWSANNIGENGKFDNFIRDNGGSTCAGNTPTNSSMFTCTLTVEYEIIYVGKCNGVTVDTGDCDPVSNVDGLFQFKVVDPSDIFPTGTTTDSGKAIAKNWTDTAEGQQVKNEIETRGKKGETYSHDRLTYQFNLTPATMRHIKNYNTSRNTNNIGGYSDFNMTCSCPSNVQTDTLKSGGVGCTQCKSNLLTDLANNQITYNNHTYTGLNVWDSTKNIQEVRNSVWG